MNNLKIDSIGFDLDGTLLNTIGDLAEAANEMLRRRNLPQHDYATYCTFVGNGIMRLVDVFHCVPSTPLLIILGAAMDGMRVDPRVRMLLLMLVRTVKKQRQRKAVCCG